MPRRYQISPPLLLIFAAAPACFVLYAISKYGVDLPFGDEWETVALLTKKAQGTLTFSDLFALLNEYRQFFPNLLFVHLGWLTGWDVRYEMFLSFLLAAVVSYNVWRLGSRTLGGVGTSRQWAFLLSNLVIFSPAQYENWLMGQQVIFFIPIACVTTCLLVSVSQLRAWQKFVICFSLSAVSSFSSANGILCWVVTFPVLAGAETWKGFARHRWLNALWVVGFGLCVILYFYDFRRPTYLPPTSESFFKPGPAFGFFLSLLGSPLTGQSRPLLPVAAVVGLALAFFFVRAWVSFFRAAPGTGLRPRLLCWLMLGSYSVLTAGLVTFGRSGLGLHYALSSRYTTFSLYLIVALIHLAVIAREGSEKRQPQTARSPARVRLSLTLTLVVLHLLASAVSARQMSWLRTRLLQAKACVLFVNLLGDRCIDPELFAFPSMLPDRANALDALGFMRPALIRSRRVQDFAGSGEPHPAYGSFERLIREGDFYVASGSATLPYRGEPPDAVLLTYRDGLGWDVTFALAELDYKGDFLERLRGGQAGGFTSWRASFPAGVLPADASELSAWAFDANTGRTFRLGHTRGLP